MCEKKTKIVFNYDSMEFYVINGVSWNIIGFEFKH